MWFTSESYRLTIKFQSKILTHCKTARGEQRATKDLQSKHRWERKRRNKKKEQNNRTKSERTKRVRPTYITELYKKATFPSLRMWAILPWHTDTFTQHSTTRSKTTHAHTHTHTHLHQPSHNNLYQSVYVSNSQSNSITCVVPLEIDFFYCVWHFFFCCWT